MKNIQNIKTSKSKQQNKTLNSPFFYTGSKYKLIPQLKELFPSDIKYFFDVFYGGGVVSLNTKAEKYFLNDINYNIINLHNLFKIYATYSGRGCNLYRLEEFLRVEIKNYGLSSSYFNLNPPSAELKKQYGRQILAKHNKNAYLKLRNDWNLEKNNPLLLYLLLIYCFNHTIRFNSKGEFNMPVGNGDYNQNVHDYLVDYFSFMEINGENVHFNNMDFRYFFQQHTILNDDYVYCDPPYFISNALYNLNWNEKDEIDLCNKLDELNNKGVRFGISNLVVYKGRTNDRFLKWSEKYYCYDIKSNYICFHDNTIKSDSKEVFVTNYQKQSR